MNFFPISLYIWMLKMPKIQRENILKRRIYSALLYLILMLVLPLIKLAKYTRRGKLDSCVPFAHFCSGVVSAWCRLLSYNIASGHLLRKSDLWPVDLFKKEPLKGNSEVHLHTATKFGEDPSKDLGGVGEQTNAQTLLEL